MVKKQITKKAVSKKTLSQAEGFEPMKMTFAVSATAVVSLTLMALIAMS
jgi:hypothetical protein